jgi:hypothetical protein
VKDAVTQGRGSDNSSKESCLGATLQFVVVCFSFLVGFPDLDNQ